MKLKQLLEQLRYILIGFLYILPTLITALITWYGLNYLKENGLLKEFSIVIATILAITFMYIIGKSATK